MSFWEYLSKNIGYVITIVAVIAVIIIGCLLKKTISDLLFKNKKKDDTNGNTEKDVTENKDDSDTEK